MARKSSTHHLAQELRIQLSQAETRQERVAAIIKFLREGLRDGSKIWVTDNIEPKYGDVGISTDINANRIYVDVLSETEIQCQPRQPSIANVVTTGREWRISLPNKSVEVFNVYAAVERDRMLRKMKDWLAELPEDNESSKLLVEEVKSPDSPLIAVVWDPAVMSETEYAMLIKSLGDIIRSEGGLGIQRVKELGFELPVGVGVNQ